MSIVNANVIRALLETYLKERMAGWGMELLYDGRLKLPVKDWNYDKVTKCNALLNLIPIYSTRNLESNTPIADDWIDFVYDLYEMEESEIELNEQQTYALGIYTPSHLLLDVMRAIRSYVLMQLSDEAAYKTLTEDLARDIRYRTEDVDFYTKHLTEDDKYQELLKAAKADLEVARNNELPLRTPANENYLNTYFKANILGKPVKADKEEPDFTAFVKNVETGVRGDTICKAVKYTLDSLNKGNNNKGEAQKVQNLEETPVNTKLESPSSTDDPELVTIYKAPLPKPAANNNHNSKKKKPNKALLFTASPEEAPPPSQPADAVRVTRSGKPYNNF